MARKHAALEAEILRVAADIFSEKGYRAATVDDLASGSGMSRATFYAYFPSKEDVLRRLYEEVTSSTQVALERIVAAKVSVREKLRRIIRFQVAYLAEHKPLARVFFSEVFHLPPATNRAVTEANRRFTRVIESVVEQGIDERAIVAADPKRFTYAIIGMCNWMLRWYRPEGAWTPELVAGEFIQLLEEGYLSDPRRETHDAAVMQEVRRLRETVERLEATLRASSASPRHGSDEAAGCGRGQRRAIQ